MTANLALLEEAAHRISPFLDEVVFVGGAVVDLLLTDPAGPPTRATRDVDVVIQVATYAEYVAFTGRLSSMGFRHDESENAPVCRMICEGLILDVLATDPMPLGFGNRWYKDAVNHCKSARLPSGRVIRAITAPYFLGTKFEAFRDRGKSDMFCSHDFEDIVTVLDGCDSIIEQATAAPEDLRLYLHNAAATLIANARLTDALSGCLEPDTASQSRLPAIVNCLTQLAEL